MKRAAATRVEGRLLGFENQTVVPSRAILEPAPGVVSIVRTATVSPDGRFTFFGLRPGKYKVIVPPRGDRTSDQTYAITTFDVRGEAVLPVALKMERALWIAGDITFDGREQPYFGVQDVLVGHRQPGLPAPRCRHAAAGAVLAHRRSQPFHDRGPAADRIRHHDAGISNARMAAGRSGRDANAGRPAAAGCVHACR